MTEDSVRAEVIALRQDLQKLTEEIKKLTSTTGRMDNHIDFVENVYIALRAPLDYIRQRWWGNDDALALPPASTGGIECLLMSSDEED